MNSPPNRFWLLIGTAFFLTNVSGCYRAELERQAAVLAEENAQLRKIATESENNSNDTRSRLVHLVWFKLKPELSKEQIENFIGEVNKLQRIDFVDEFEVGNFADLGDQRAMHDLQMIMSMKFDTEQQYRDYQAHPVHLELKNAAGDYLAGPPVTYDYRSVAK